MSADAQLFAALQRGENPLATPQPQPTQPAPRTAESMVKNVDQSDLISTVVQREASRMAVQSFPDATPQQAVQIAREFQKQLSKRAGPTTREDLRPSPEERKRQIQEANKFFADTIGAIGGAAGTMLGGPAGGMLGASAGGLAGAGIRALSGEDISVGDALRMARNEGAAEGTAIIGLDMIGGGLARMLRGNKQAADETIQALQAVGIRPSLQDFATTSFAEGGRRTLGSIPLLSRPFKRRQAQISKQIDKSIQDYIGEVSPDVLLLKRVAQRDGPEAAADLQRVLSERLSGNLDKGIVAAKQEMDTRFKRLRQAEQQIEARAEDQGIRIAIPTLHTRARMAQIAGEIEDMRVRTASGNLEEVGELSETIDFVRRISGNQLSPTMQFSELRRLKGAIGRRIDRIETDRTSKRFLTVLKEGVEEDMAELASRHPVLNRAYTEAMGYSEEFMTLMQEIAAKRGRRFNRGFGFEPTRVIETETGAVLQKNAGTLDISQMVDTISNASGPNEVRQFFDIFRRGVGEEEARKTIRIALGKKFDEAVDRSFVKSVERAGDPSYKPGQLLRELGMDSPNSKKFQSTVELFRAAGLKPDMPIKYAKAIDAIFSVKNPKVSQFVQRSAQLRLARGLRPGVLAGAFTGGIVGGSGGSALVPAAMMVLIGRSVGKTLTSPRRARAIVTLADISRPEQARARAAFSLVNDPTIWTSDEPEEKAQLQVIREQAQSQLRAPRGRKEFIKNLDAEIDLPRLGGRGR